MNDQLVSIIVPTYNRSYCISRAIDSVRNQTHSNWEIVVVDDGSTDDTSSLISSKYGDDPRVRYVYQTNAGVSAARNTGIRESRGDYVAFLDSDDIWKSWKLETQLACFNFFPQVGMVWTNFDSVDPDGELVPDRTLTTVYEAHKFFKTRESLFRESRPLSDILDIGNRFDPNSRAYVGNIYKAMFRGSLVHTSTAMLSRERIEKVKGFDESLAPSGEDYDFHFRTCKWGDVCLADVPSTLYQLGFDDRLTKFRKVIADNFLKTVQAAVEREKDSGAFPPALIHEVLAEAHSWTAYESFKIDDYAGIRKHAPAALKHKLWQPKMMGIFGYALLPPAISKTLIQGFRGFKSLLGAGKPN